MGINRFNMHKKKSGYAYRGPEGFITRSWDERLALSTAAASLDGSRASLVLSRFPRFLSLALQAAAGRNVKILLHSDVNKMIRETVKKILPWSPLPPSALWVCFPPTQGKRETGISL